MKKRSIQSGHWYWVSKEVIHVYGTTLGVSALAVYHVLASMVNKHQRCFPSQQYIANLLGCSRPTVHKAIERLKQYQLIAIEKRRRNQNTYYLLEVGCKPHCHQMLNKNTSDVKPVNTNNTYITKKINNGTTHISKLIDTKRSTLKKHIDNT